MAGKEDSMVFECSQCKALRPSEGIQAVRINGRVLFFCKDKFPHAHPGCLPRFMVWYRWNVLEYRPVAVL